MKSQVIYLWVFMILMTFFISSDSQILNGFDEEEEPHVIFQSEEQMLEYAATVAVEPVDHVHRRIDTNRIVGLDERMLQTVTDAPTKRPTLSPSAKPTRLPTETPTKRPTKEPTVRPTRKPTQSPSKRPTKEPTQRPTRVPTDALTKRPTNDPTQRPSRSPTTSPTKRPTAEPTKRPTRHPTDLPTKIPTVEPSTKPTRSPTNIPTKLPTADPTFKDSLVPTYTPTGSPAQDSTQAPTNVPVQTPTQAPSLAPVQTAPTASPTVGQTSAPTVVFPSTMFFLESMYFNGSVSKMIGALPTTPGFQFSISMWITTTSTASATLATIARTPSNFDSEFIFNVKSSGVLEAWEYGSGVYGVNFAGTIKVNTGARTHVAVVKDNNVAKLYVNGVLDTTGTCTAAISTKNIGFNLGNDARSKNAYFKGTMDHVYVYDRSLTAAEVQTMYTYFIQPPTFAPTMAPTQFPTNPTYLPTAAPSARPSVMPPTVAVIFGGENRSPTLGFQLVNALKVGDASNVTGYDLRRTFVSLVDSISTVRTSIITSIFTNSSNQAKFTDITWSLSHDSVTFSVADTSSTFPLFMSNHNYGGGTDPSKAVATFGFFADTGRHAAFGVNPFAVKFTNNVPILKNTIAWMNKGVDPSTAASFRITIAQIPGPSSYYFNYDAPTHNWFKANYPNAVVNHINACDNSALDGCLANSQLLVIGCQIDRIGDSATADLKTNVAQLSAAVKTFLENGGAVMYVHHYREGNAITDAVLPLLGVSTLPYPSNGNYFQKAGLLNYNPFASTSLSPLDYMYKSIQTLQGVTPLVTADICTSESTWPSCSNADFLTKMKTGVLAVRTVLAGFDNKGVDLFGATATNQYVFEKILVLLGDKYRTVVGTREGSTPLINYPIQAGDYDSLAQAMFADCSVLYTRKKAPKQENLGNVYCSYDNTYLGKSGCADYKNFETRAPRFYEHVVQDAGIYPNDVWTSTGVFALPGVPFTVTRSDDRKDIKLYVAMWYQRDGTTKSLDASSNFAGYTQYSRPQYMRSPYILLSNNTEITITSPYGGPIYFGLISSGVTRTSSAPLSCTFSNVAKHSAILDVGNDTLLAAFPNDVKSNIIPIIDIKAPGMEMHLRADFFLGQLKLIEFMQDYSGVNGVKNLMYDLRVNFLEAQMTLAGFKAPGKKLSESLPPTNLAACQALKWNCTDTTVHLYSGIQHANYDDRSLCGSGCSGNPFDMAWSITPLGWGEAHELGHNMQMSLMAINWLGAGKSRDVWADYAGRAGENSNNIFPYHNQWKYYRYFQNYSGIVPDARSRHLEGFMTLQSGYARVNKTVAGVQKTVVFDKNCAIAYSYNLGTPIRTVVQDSILASSAYAADNDARMSFYQQLTFIFSNMKVVGDAVTIKNGFEVITLLYQGARTLNYIAKSDTTWKKHRDTIGFGLFNRTCAATDPCNTLYGGKSVTSMVGNDYMVVMLSFLSGYDFRAYFDLRGMFYSTLADRQVVAHINSGRVNKGPVLAEYYGIDDFPPATVVGGRVKKFPIDGVASWTFNDWSVSKCAATIP